MCLEYLTEITAPNEGEGWKVFWFENEINEIRGYSIPTAYSINTWHSKEGDPLQSSKEEPYPSGFHIFINKLDAEKFLEIRKPVFIHQNRFVKCFVIKVNYKNVLAQGKQNIKFYSEEDDILVDCIVTNEMMIDLMIEENNVPNQN